MFLRPWWFWFAVTLLTVHLLPFAAFAAEDLESLVGAISRTLPNSEAEFNAMTQAIDAAHHLRALPSTSAAAADAVAKAQDLAKAAQTPQESLTAATAFGEAARLAPWVAEVQFQRGKLLVKGAQPLAAGYAFSLYLRAAPQAKDKREVATLIAALRDAAPSSQPDEAVKTSRAAPPSRPGDTFQDCPQCPPMVVIPGGTFTMGSPATEAGRFDSEGPQHPVSVRSLALGRYPVTQKEFATFLAETAYQPDPCDRRMDKSWRSLGHGLVYPPGTADLHDQPAVCLNVRDIEAYLVWLNRKAGATALYRLPTEAEWEYAARAGTTTSRWWGEAVGVNNANCHGCGSKWDDSLIAPVGSFAPNPFELYDVLGNVWQWTADCWNESYAGAPLNGQAWTGGDCNKRVIRGGSWSNLPVFIRAAARGKADAAGHDFDLFSYVGFRVAKDLVP